MASCKPMKATTNFLFLQIISDYYSPISLQSMLFNLNSDVVTSAIEEFPIKILQNVFNKDSTGCGNRIWHYFDELNIRNKKLWSIIIKVPFNIRLSFIHSVFCLTTGPKPPLKRFLHIVRSRPSSFKWQYPLLSLTFKRLMSDICDGTPTLSPPNDRNIRRPATGISSGADRFMMSNKTIPPDHDPCQWMKLKFPKKEK